MTQRDRDKIYMERALSLARMGEAGASPNPMVGAVIVSGDDVIGEGFHVRCGGPHAEVRAIRSVRNRSRIPGSTVYVTLEPCAHYGKTPPCADMLVREGIGRVVVGVVDPFSKVSGRGIAILRDAGIEVTVGVLEDKCRWINRKFFTAHELRRPYVTLKWACSSDGMMDHRREPGRETAACFSTEITRLDVMRLRACHDALAVGSGTVLADDPLLTVRDIAGVSPIRVVFDRSGRVNSRSRVFADDGIRVIHLTEDRSLAETLRYLYTEGVTSMLVEGGPRLLRSFISSGLWDEVRREMSPAILGTLGTAPAPPLPDGIIRERCADNNIIASVYSFRFTEIISALRCNI